MTASGPEPRLRDRAANAFGWIAAAKLLERGLGAIRIVVFARLLAPEDFGAFAIAALALGTLERFTRPGVGVALVQRKEDVGPCLDPAWTLLLLRAWALAAVLYLSRNAVAAFFETPAAVPLIAIVAAATAIGGFTSLSLLLLQRELRLENRFRAIAASSFADLAVALPLAWILRDPIALAYGLLARNVCLVLASFLVHPYRPRFTLAWGPLRAIRDFALHGAYQSWLFFLVEEGDDAFVGKLLGGGALGLYQVGYRTANVATQEVARMISEVAVPVLSRLQDDVDRLAQGLRESLGVTAAAVVPGAILLAIVASEFVRFFLGDPWLEVVPTFRILLVFGVARALSHSCEAILTARGDVRFLTRVLGTQLAVAVVLVGSFGWWLGLPGVAIGVTGSQLASLGMSLSRSGRLLDRSRRSLVSATGGAWLGAASGLVTGGVAHVVLASTSAAGLAGDVFVLLGTALAFGVPYLWIALPRVRAAAPTVAAASLDPLLAAFGRFAGRGGGKTDARP